MGGKVMSSCWDVMNRWIGCENGLASKDWAYQFLTLLIDGIALKLCGNSSSSFTRCARRTGNSSIQVRLIWVQGRRWLHLTRTGLLSGEFLDLGFVQTIPFAATRLEKLVSDLEKKKIRNPTASLREGRKMVDLVP